MPSLPVSVALTGDGVDTPSSTRAVGSGTAIAVELIEDRSQIPLSAAEWNELVARNETNSIFQTYQWFDAWWRTFGDAHQLFFLLLRQEGRIVGFGGTNGTFLFLGSDFLIENAISTMADTITSAISFVFQVFIVLVVSFYNQMPYRN